MVDFDTNLIDEAISREFGKRLFDIRDKAENDTNSPESRYISNLRKVADYLKRWYDMLLYTADDETQHMGFFNRAYDSLEHFMMAPDDYTCITELLLDYKPEAVRTVLEECRLPDSCPFLAAYGNAAEYTEELLCKVVYELFGDDTDKGKEER